MVTFQLFPDLKKLEEKAENVTWLENGVAYTSWVSHFLQKDEEGAQGKVRP